jgi:hypothetical protein
MCCFSSLAVGITALAEPPIIYSRVGSAQLSLSFVRIHTRFSLLL